MTKSCGSTQLRRSVIGSSPTVRATAKSERNAEGHRGPTVLLEIEGSGLPTDPTFDPVGGYIFGWGTGCRRTSRSRSVEQARPVSDRSLTRPPAAGAVDARGVNARI